MRLDTFLLAVLTASLFIVGGSLIFGNVIDTYDINTTTDDAGFNNVYNTINETYDISMDMKNETLDAETEGGDESWESLVKGGYGAVRLIRNSFVLANDMLHAISLHLGIPQFIVDVAIIAITICIIFAIIYLVFRFKG